MLSIIIPTFNRSETLAKTIEAVRNSRVSCGNQPYEIVIVDDGSSDATASVMKELSSRYQEVRGLVLKGNYGQQNATLAGIRMSQYDYVVTLDDDLKYDLDQVEVMMDKLMEGYEAVYGVYPTSPMNQGFRRHMGTLLKEELLWLLCHKPRNLTLTSFRILGPSAKTTLIQDMTPRIYLSASLLKSTKNIGNIPVDISNPYGHESGYTGKKLVGMMLHIWRYYSRIGRLLPYKHRAQYEIKEVYE